jgi:hypothetical protein
MMIYNRGEFAVVQRIKPPEARLIVYYTKSFTVSYQNVSFI